MWPPPLPQLSCEVNSNILNLVLKYLAAAKTFKLQKQFEIKDLNKYISIKFQPVPSFFDFQQDHYWMLLHCLGQH